MGIYNEEWTTSFSVSWHWWFWFVSANSINIKAQPANMIDKCAKFLKLMTFVSLFCCCVLDWKQVRVCNGNHLFWAEHGFFFCVLFNKGYLLHVVWLRYTYELEGWIQFSSPIQSPKVLSEFLNALYMSVGLCPVCFFSLLIVTGMFVFLLIACYWP